MCYDIIISDTLLPLHRLLSHKCNFPNRKIHCLYNAQLNGSAGGPDRLQPQHLKDMTSKIVDPEDSPLLSALCDFCSLVLQGNTPVCIRPFFFGANLVALRKSQGGVRPIAVGCTLRRLVAKVVSGFVVDDMADLLSPRQLGYGVRGGAEAAVHAARCFLSSMPSDHAMVKLDFKNAFNSIRRDKMLEACLRFAPDVYPFVFSAYSSPSNLFWGKHQIASAEGVQQGDPLGPLLFCLSIFSLGQQFTSDLSILYLDDISIGGPCDVIIEDLKAVMEASSLGLTLNVLKSEIITGSSPSRDCLLTVLPGARLVNPSQASLLGSPIGDVNCVSSAIEEKTATLRSLSNNLNLLSAHDAFTLLRSSLAIPKLLYLLRTAPCFGLDSLSEFDSVLVDALSKITNTPLTLSSPSWLQASLPVKFGGLGIRSAVDIAPSAFLASAHSTAPLVSSILQSSFPLRSPFVSSALSLWSRNVPDVHPPSGDNATRQKAWDTPGVELASRRLLEGAQDCQDRARLLAASCGESGAWLNALPLSSVGLRLDDDSLRIAVGLRLGTPLCGPHQCCNCGEEVDITGRHGLSCSHSKGRLPRHAALNDIIHRALSTAKIPSRLEPSGLSRVDGKRPDGVTIMPWSAGKPMVWDATCSDTFATSYRAVASQAAGGVAANAEVRKELKYANLSHSHCFMPLSVESTGVFGPRTFSFVKDLGRRMTRQSGNVNATSYLKQRLSMAIQRGNAISVLGTCNFLPLPDFL